MITPERLDDWRIVPRALQRKQRGIDDHTRKTRLMEDSSKVINIVVHGGILSNV